MKVHHPKTRHWVGMGLINTIVTVMLAMSYRWPIEKAATYFVLLLAMTLAWHYIFQWPPIDRRLNKVAGFFTRKRREKSVQEMFDKISNGRGKMVPEDLLRKMVDGFTPENGHPGQHIGDIAQAAATAYRALMETLHHTKDKTSSQLHGCGMEVDLGNYMRMTTALLYVLSILAEKDKHFRTGLKGRLGMHEGIIAARMQLSGDKEGTGEAIKDSIDAVKTLLEQSSLREEIMDHLGNVIEDPYKNLPAMRKYLPGEGLDGESFVSHAKGTLAREKDSVEGEERTFDGPSRKSGGSKKGARYQQDKERTVRRSRKDISW